MVNCLISFNTPPIRLAARFPTALSFRLDSPLSLSSSSSRLPPPRPFFAPRSNFFLPIGLPLSCSKLFEPTSALHLHSPLSPARATSLLLLLPLFLSRTVLLRHEKDSRENDRRGGKVSVVAVPSSAQRGRWPLAMPESGSRKKEIAGIISE